MGKRTHSTKERKGRWTRNQKLSLWGIVVSAAVALILKFLGCGCPLQIEIVKGDASGGYCCREAVMSNIVTVTQIITQQVTTTSCNYSRGKETTVVDCVPGGRKFTTSWVTNNVRITLTRLDSKSIPHSGPDRWGVVSNTCEFANGVAEMRKLYARGEYSRAAVRAEQLKSTLQKMISDSGFTNFIFDWPLQLNVTSLLELCVENEFAEGRFESARKIAKEAIADLPRAPNRLAALYFAADMMTANPCFVSYQRLKIETLNDQKNVQRLAGDSYCDWENWFDFDDGGVLRQLALWGYIHPILVDNDENLVVCDYSTVLSLPDDLPYPTLYHKWWGFGDYYCKRWCGFGREEEFNVSEYVRRHLAIANRMRRDAVLK